MQLIDDAGRALTEAVHSVFPDAPAEAVRLGGGALLGMAALLLAVFALRLFFKGSRTRSPKRVNIPRALQRSGAVIDILRSPNDDAVPVRCVITSVSSGKIKCEIIERLDILGVAEGKEVTCVFTPIRNGKGKVNAFQARLVESDRSGRRADRIVLAAPRDYALIPRRKHGRKRVADQQFIRVKLWVTAPFDADLSFEDAAPHIGVNSFGNGDPSQSANAVINISNGGLGLSVLDRILPETCAVGSGVTINLFMFNFRERTFKPYWYSGRVRSMTEGSPGFTRMGIEFDGQARVDGRTGILAWEKF
ncbi:MAG: hypothetical protein V3571_07005 [Pseudodesulfovibrio sp.]